MKTLVIVGIVVSLILVAGIFLAGNITAHEDGSNANDSAYGCNSDSCPNYGSGCTSEDNCGLETCVSVSSNGQKPRGCGR